MPSSPRCCTRRRRRARSRNCQVRRSDGRAAVRHCTTPQPRWCRRRPQQVADDLLDRSAVNAEGVVADGGDDPIARASRAPPPPRAASSDSAVMWTSICPGAARMVVSIGGTACRKRPVDRLNGLLDVRLGTAGDENRRAIEPFATRAPAEQGRGHSLEHRLQLSRRSRQQEHDTIADLDQQPRRAAIRVVEDCGASRAPSPAAG